MSELLEHLTVVQFVTVYSENDNTANFGNHASGYDAQYSTQYNSGMALLDQRSKKATKLVSRRVWGWSDARAKGIDKEKSDIAAVNKKNGR